MEETCPSLRIQASVFSSYCCFFRSLFPTVAQGHRSISLYLLHLQVGTALDRCTWNCDSYCITPEMMTYIRPGFVVVVVGAILTSLSTVIVALRYACFAIKAPCVVLI